MGRASSVQASRADEERELRCLAWSENLIALPTATEFGKVQG